MPKAKPAKAQPKIQDPVKVDAKHYKVEAQNKKVRVLRVTYGPGEKYPDTPRQRDYLKRYNTRQVGALNSLQHR